MYKNKKYILLFKYYVCISENIIGFLKKYIF